MSRRRERIPTLGFVTLILLLATTTITPSAFAYEAVRVNAVAAGSQVAPDISGNRVVWLDETAYNDIETKNLSTGVEQTVYAGTTERNWPPTVEGDRVIWSRGHKEIMMKDVGTGILTTLTASRQSNPPGLAFLPDKPAIDGGTVVWEDLRNGEDPGDIYGKTIGGSEFEVMVAAESQLEPDVSGSTIVWSDNSGFDFDIRMKRSGTLYSVTGSASGDQESPAISGNMVTWEDGRGLTKDVYAKDVSNVVTNPEILLAGDHYTSLSAPGAVLADSIQVNSLGDVQPGDQLVIVGTDPQGQPISQSLVVASLSLPNTINLTTSLVDAYPTGSPVTAPRNQTAPAVYSSGTGYRVVWQDDRKGDWDVYMYDSASSQTTAVANDIGTDQAAPRISGQTVVWQDNREGAWDIYMTSVGPPSVSDDGAWSASTSTLHATWSYTGPVTDYRYAVGTTPGGTDIYSWHSAGTSTEITVSGLSLDSGTTYYISVKAFDGSAETEPGTTDGITVDTQGPTAPSTLSATGGSSQAVPLTWSTSTDSGSGLAYYRLSRATAEGGPYTTVATTTATSRNDTGLTNGQPYWYKVNGVDNLGNEGPSSSVASATPLAAAPTVSDGAQWTNETATLHAGWSAVAGATGYQYAVGTSAGAADVEGWASSGMNTEVTATIDPPLSNGQKYYLSVRAMNGSNVSSHVGSTDGVTVDTQGPTAPANLAASSEDGGAALQWEASSDTGSGVDHYVIYLEGDATATATTASHVVNGLENGTSYTFYVQAVDKVGNVGGMSNEASVTPAVQLPSALTIARDLNAIYYWWTAKISGRLTEAGTTTGIQASNVEIQQRRVGLTAWSTAPPGVAAVTTAANGSYLFGSRPAYNTDYRAFWPGSGTHTSITSPIVRVHVRPRVYLNASTYSIRRGRTLVLTGNVIPRRGGKLMQVRYRYGKYWKNLGLAKTDYTSASRYTYRYTPRYPGLYLFRVNFNGDSLNAWSTSRYIKVRVY